jgi:hypothetical protein
MSVMVITAKRQRNRDADLQPLSGEPCTDPNVRNGRAMMLPLGGDAFGLDRTSGKVSEVASRNYA